MAESHPPEGPLITSTSVAASSVPPGPVTLAATTTNSTATIVLADNNNNVDSNLVSSIAPKRHRRPSVRLGEIGDIDPRRPKTWRFHKDPSVAAKASKTRPLTNLVTVNSRDNCHVIIDSDAAAAAVAAAVYHNNFDFGGRKPKSKKPTRRVRTNWTSSSKGDNNGVVSDCREDNNNVEEFREFDPQDSDSPLKEQSPIHSADNMALDFWHARRRLIGARVSETRNNNHDDEFPESNSGDIRCGTSSDGVRDWLIGLGLGRYGPVFEIHEVDDEVLPMLTLEDLKDMGINAVGSRRKLYSAILKLRKGFS